MKAIEILEKSKRTHEDWLAFFLRCPDEEKKDEYKHIGDRFHQEKCINNYEKAIKNIEQLQAENKRLKEGLKTLEDECQKGRHMEGHVATAHKITQHIFNDLEKADVHWRKMFSIFKALKGGAENE